MHIVLCTLKRMLSCRRRQHYCYHGNCNVLLLYTNECLGCKAVQCTYMSPTSWMGLIIPSPSVFNLNLVTPAYNPAAHNLSLTSLKLRHTWETHIHPLSSVPWKLMETHWGERGQLTISAHTTLHRPSPPLSVSLQRNRWWPHLFSCFPLRTCKTREPVVMVTHAARMLLTGHPIG